MIASAPDRETQFRAEILARRTAALAAAPTAAAAPTISVLVIACGDTLLALPLENVSRVARRPRLALLPQGPRERLGLADFEGAFRPIWDLAALLRLSADEREDGRLALLRCAEGSLAVHVSRVVAAESVTAAGEDELASAPRSHFAVRALVRRGDLLLPLLDAGALLRAVADLRS